MKDYSNFKWIKVNKFTFDSTKSWEENFKQFEKHHIEETTFLINEIKKLSEDSKFLLALRHAGVDNWEGYSYAQDLLEKNGVIE